MIKTKEDLKYYIHQDWLNLHKPNKKCKIFKYEVNLRKLEYFLNKDKKNIFDKIALGHHKRIHQRNIDKYQTSIPPNVCGPGLSIGHFGSIYVNGKSKIGKNLRIQVGVVVGGAAGKEVWPVIGDNVYLGSGAKIIGPAIIPDNVAIGCNAVVTKEIKEPNTTWAGVPAKKISDNNSHAYLATEVLES